MEHTSLLERVLRGIALCIVVVFFMFPILWIVLMSFQTNETILRVPPSAIFEPTLENYKALITGKLETSAASLEIKFLKNLGNSVLLSVGAVSLSLLLGVPAAYAFARHKFRGSEDIAFTLLSFRFAPPLLVLLPLSLYFPKNRARRYLRRINLGLPVNLSSVNTLDCSRLFRRYIARY